MAMKMDSASNTMDMPQDLARRLFEEGAILILSGIPVGTEFGVDLTVHKVGENFRGVKMIPPGPHFVFTAAQGPYGDSANRVGFIHYFQKQEIVIREWDDDKEELRVRTKVDSIVETARIRDNIQQLDPFLAPYDFQGVQKWKHFVEDITGDVVSRCAPLCGIVRASVEFVSCPDADRPKGASPLTTRTTVKPNQSEEELLPNMQVVPGTAPRFTKIPPLCALSASPAEISFAHLDSCDAITKLFEKFDKPMELIAEVQLAFVLYLAGCSVDALAHWRKLLGLLAKSEVAVTNYRSFYRRYLEVLHFQLPELPEELMPPSENNTVLKDTRSLVLNCSTGGLKNEVDALVTHLSRTMLWTFDNIFEEDPDDLPVVVEL